MWIIISRLFFRLFLHLFYILYIPLMELTLIIMILWYNQCALRLLLTTDTFSYNCALVTALVNLDQHSIKDLFIMKILRAQLHQINLPYHYLFDVLWCLCADSKNSYKEQSFYNFLLILSFWGSRIPTAISWC